MVEAFTGDYDRSVVRANSIFSRILRIVKIIDTDPNTVVQLCKFLEQN